MCWSAEVSLQSFLVGMASVGIGALKGVYLPSLIFCVSVTLMQLVEYFAWSGYDNRTVSLAAAGLLWFQPVAAILFLESSPLRNAFLLAYAIAAFLVGDLELKDNYTMTRAPNGHLAWNWLTDDIKAYLRIAVYMFFLIVPPVLSGYLPYVLLSGSLLAVSLYSFWKENTWGSMWCWYINSAIPLFIGVQTYLKR